MKKKEFWITNISKMNVGLADLNLTVKPLSSINLLDKRHYFYTLEQLELSANNGSIFKKKDKIIVRHNAPETTNLNNIKIIKDGYIPSRGKSVFQIKEEFYEELNISDVQFADDNAEIADLDSQPIIKKDQHVTSKTTK